MSTNNGRAGIYYEHPDWFRPLFQELDRRNVPYDALHADTHSFDPSRAPEHAVVFNRLSPSAWLRGRAHAIHYTSEYLHHLEHHGVRVLALVAARIETGSAQRAVHRPVVATDRDGALHDR